MKKNHRFAISWLPQSETRIGRHTDSKSGERIRNPNQLTLSDLVWSSALQPFDHIFDGYQTTGLDLVQRLGLSGQPLVARQRPRTPFRRPTVFLNDPRTRHAHPLGPECPRQLPLPVPVPIPLPKRVLSTVSAAPEKLRKFLLKNGLDRGSDVLP